MSTAHRRTRTPFRHNLSPPHNPRSFLRPAFLGTCFFSCTCLSEVAGTEASVGDRVLSWLRAVGSTICHRPSTTVLGPFRCTGELYQTSIHRIQSSVDLDPQTGSPSRSWNQSCRTGVVNCSCTSHKDASCHRKLLLSLL